MPIGPTVQQDPSLFGDGGGSERLAEDRVGALLEQMTLAEKIGQMTQVEKGSITPDAVAQYAIGSMLSGGGGNPTPNTPQSWVEMVNGFQAAALRSRLGIPLLYGVDAVHGHNNVVGATIFPHNVGLGATRNPELVRQVARITAREMVATGVHWNFAPCVAVPQDFRWGRTYEGYGEDPALVAGLTAAYVHGLQAPSNGLKEKGVTSAVARRSPLGHPESVLASAKHFVGDGGTTWGSTGRYPWVDWGWHSPDDRWSIDQGITEVDEATLRAVHLPPYAAAIAAGTGSIMVSYSSWGGQKMHAHRYLLTDVLKEEMGFDGFLISDWMAINQIDPDYYTCVVRSINAGLDMVMVPFEYELFIQTLTDAVNRGDVPLARIDDAVRRILTVKVALRLWERPFGVPELLPEIGSAAHRQVARDAVRQSLVLLKNEAATLPLPRSGASILVAGPAADDIGLQCGGWTIEWAGRPGPITPGTTLLEGLKTAVSDEAIIHHHPTGDCDADLIADVGLVVLSEQPYAEGEGDRADLTLPAADAALIARVRPHCRRLVVVLYTGRPLIITSVLAQCDAFVVAWLPGTEGDGVTDVLFGDYPFTGRLPYSWPRRPEQIPLARLRTDSEPPLFVLGHGLPR